jgi:crotonobetainyl-CoA:carnitine CoA-transferase CaiB-like acyl-CoA transferase
MPDMALSDITILDFTHHISGPYCTKLLADYGAEVIKIERPGSGDPARTIGPFPKDVPHLEKSGTFLHLNTNKRSVTLDLNSESGREIVLKLAQRADIVVESFRPGIMAGFGLDYSALASVNPALVVTSISNFGQTGPYRDWRASELIFYGMGGELYSTGLASREPVKMGATVGLYQAGAIAAYASLSASFTARETGAGEHIDISIMETQAGSIDRRMSMLLAYQYNAEISGRAVDGNDGFGGYPNGVYPCADGYFQITGGTRYFSRIVEMLGNPEELQDARWYTPEAQSDSELAGEFDAIFYPWILERTKSEVWSEAQKAKVLSGPLNTMEDIANDKVFQSRDVFTKIEHPVAGELTYPGRPFIMEHTPWSIRRPAPRLGEHTGEVQSELGYSPTEISSFREEGIA